MCRYVCNIPTTGTEACSLRDGTSSYTPRGPVRVGALQNSAEAIVDNADVFPHTSLK